MFLPGSYLRSNGLLTWAPYFGTSSSLPRMQRVGLMPVVSNNRFTVSIANELWGSTRRGGGGAAPPPPAPPPPPRPGRGGARGPPAGGQKGQFKPP